MKNLVFLASANALKPVILIESFYNTSNRDSKSDILLTNDDEGNVVEYARSRGMRIIVTNDLHFSDKEWLELQKYNFEDSMLVSCGWPYKIPEELLNVFKVGVNCHGSYLPDYRGSRAYMHYWANCSEFFGATIHYLNNNFDDGNIIIRSKQKLFIEDSQDVVFYRTAELCGILLVSALFLVDSNFKGFVPSEGKRYFYKMTPEEFQLHRKKNEMRIKNGEKIILTPHKEL